MKLRVVTPYQYRAEPESEEHRAVGPFDWISAIEMLRASVRRSCRCHTVTITDLETVVPGRVFRYDTRERHLMLWILEVALCYLAGPHFDRDTVMLSPDQLVFGDLRTWFGGDFGIVVRPEHAERPILNAVQWWPRESRAALIDLYTRALAIATTLPPALITWGADSEPFRQLLEPIEPGLHHRSGLTVHMVDSRIVVQPCSSDIQAALEQGWPIKPKRAIVDFRYTRKHAMRAYFDATMGPAIADEESAE